MATLLYITVNSKPEDLSTSKTVGRIFINKYKELYPNDTIEELDLYEANIPRLNYKLFTSRATLASGEDYDKLSDEEKQQVEQIRGLCDQFLRADKYVITAPMWSIFFPSMLKQYLDCIIQDKKLINIDTVNNKVSGLLGDKKRKMVYIQSSGAKIPFLISPFMNKGVNYLHDIFKFLGLKKFDKILVDGVDDSSVGRDMAIQNATEEIDDMIEFF
ncbi:FMN-dependent NADH-azoreductase [Vallitalea guaymasensis]|uniref:FMN dependent NADH:quinone oxidoreductase n=1 Tax=Vallitalea guaymasensis TaxID=1185412 RepID=A0A8J8M791_9FIRM|nr:NAD(P)H-dependent oxidoreductase [Vallitalea guaymasensis]QUH27672.1 NAD(P)H-dependent oxidoreductase [Vallitalea guaymasensis]